MTYPLRHSTASQEIPLGYFVDVTDGDSAMTGLTIANTDIKLHKHGTTTLANKNSGGATHIAGGLYYATLDATDTDTVGGLVIFVHVATALAVRLECVVYPASVFDALVLGTGWLGVNAFAPDWSIAGATLTVQTPAQTASQTTKTLTTDAGAVPITATESS